MDENERVVRDFYAARAGRNWQAVRELLADDVAWHETGGAEDYVGDHHGGDTVAALLTRLLDATGGTFALEARDVVCTRDHAAASVRWRAERDGLRVGGDEVAVFRIAERRIAAAWFFPDGNDPDALAAVFSFAARR